MSKYKKIYPQDFKSILNVDYLESVVVKTDKLKGWDLTQDHEYKANPTANHKLTDMYGGLIEQSYQAPLYIQWINKTVHYGVFADADIKKGQMVCEYTGYLEIDDRKDSNNLYLWEYPSVIYETVPGKTRRKKVEFCVNGEMGGNFARAINHTVKKHQNVDVVMVPYNGMWHVVYRAKKDIKKGQQVLTHYGRSYWQDRKIVPSVLIP